jgi:hypothetical protein
MDSSPSVSLGALTPWSTHGEYNNIIFAVQQALNRLQTATLVRVDACTNSGDLSPVGFVDVTPLVNQIDGSTPPNPTPHVTVFGLPYLRMQGGASAVIIDPQPGDIGVAVFASRDISKVKSTKAQANPGSFRSFDFADGLYLGGMLNGTPQQYIKFSSDGITILSPENIILAGATIKAGSSPVPVVSQPFLTWVTTVLLPALAAKGITVTAPPENSLTSTFEAS